LSPALSTAPFWHEQPTCAGISRDNCSPENSNKRGALNFVKIMVSWNVMLYSVIVRHQVLGNPVAPVFRDNALGTSKFCYLSTKLQSFASKKIIIYLMPKEPRLTNLCVLVKIMSYNYLLLLRLLSLKTFPITVIHLSMSTSALGLFNILCNSSFLDIISPEGI